MDKQAMGFVYVASPYTDADEAVMVARFRAVAEYVVRRMVCAYPAARSLGPPAAIETYFSPIVHGHALHAEVGGLPHGLPFWLTHDFAMLWRANRMEVLRLPGWDKSRGVIAEIEFASKHQIPITFVDAPCDPNR